MSFGYSFGDAILLTQLAWTVVQNSRKACGEHDELTREVLSLHVVLQRLEREVAKPESLINRPGGTCGEELEVIVGGCRRVLKILDQILEKYNALSEPEKIGRRLWQKIKFGNGTMMDLADLRSKMTFHASALSLLLNMLSLGTMGRVEQQMNDAGGDLKEIKQVVNGITAHLMTRSNHEGSILTAYPDDDKAVWKDFRRELVVEGFSSSVIDKNKHLIKAYIRELGARGLLDDLELQAMHAPLDPSPPLVEETLRSTTLRDDAGAEPQSGRMPLAERNALNVQMSPKTKAEPLLALEGPSTTEHASDRDSSSGIESKLQLAEKGVPDAQYPTSLDHLNIGSILTTNIENPRQSHHPEDLRAVLSNTKSSTHRADKPTRQSEEGLEASAPDTKGAATRVEDPVQAFNTANGDHHCLQEILYLESPPEVIRAVSDAWYNEYLSTSQYLNIAPSPMARNVLENLLHKLKTVDLEAAGWSDELKACRTSLIKQMRIRINTLERITQTLRKHHICRPRCFCKSDASANTKPIKDQTKLSEKPRDLGNETYGGAPIKSTSLRLDTVRELEVSGVLHRIWHDHYDRVAPLCLKWVDIWDRKVWQLGRVQNVMSMNVEYTKLISCMRENKQQFETLDLDGDTQLIACREELTEDTKTMVNSLRIFKSDNRWRWNTSGARVKETGQRIYLDVSWVEGIIISSLGSKCRVCSAP